MDLQGAVLAASTFILASFLFCLLFPAAIVAGGDVKDVVLDSEKFAIGEKNLTPLANGLLNFTPVALGSADAPPKEKPLLVLAAKKTRRPDMLREFKYYRGGWDVTNEHYWTSVGSTGAGAFILSLSWFFLFGLAVGVHHCYKWCTSINSKESFSSGWICLILLVIFTCVASTGCILLSIGQDEFHSEVLHTLNFVVNQTEFTIQILTNVTGYLSLAKTINVDEIILPEDVQNQIDKLNLDLHNAANTLSNKMIESSEKIRKVSYEVRCVLIVTASVMLLLAVIGFSLSIFQLQKAIYIFIISGWLLVTIIFFLCGAFIILNNAVSDTCTAMAEWVKNPRAETALSDILPCVDERTTNMTLYQSKEVTRELVNIVNTVIDTIANSNKMPPDEASYQYNQSGPLMPSLCSPYDSTLNNRQCDPKEVSLTNASLVWLNYTCAVSASDLCVSSGRATPDMYRQLVEAVNASYALDYYTPLLLSLQDCNFVRDTFNTITAHYCPFLEHDLVLVNVGLGMITAGAMPCLILWIIYTKRPQREEALAEVDDVKNANGSNVIIARSA